MCRQISCKRFQTETRCHELAVTARVTQAFSYCGSKSKGVVNYPLPKYDTIFEPFAGSAAYSQYHWYRKVILYDISPFVCDTWEYLIRATKSDILALPLVDRLTNVRKLGLEKGAENLIAFSINPGVSRPRVTPTVRSQWNRKRDKLADIVHHYDDWEIHQKSYKEAPDGDYTWFIDAPYQNVNVQYLYDDVIHTELREFCLSCTGQVIVCENSKADWLPFTELYTGYGAHDNTYTDYVWYGPDKE